MYRLRWLTSQKNDDVERKCSFLKISNLKPSNTCKKYFESILLNLPLHLSAKFKQTTEWYKFFFYVATAIATVVYRKNMTKNID